MKRTSERRQILFDVLGQVYDVTEYISFHPGGVREIMKGVGRSAGLIIEIMVTRGEILRFLY